MKLILILYLLFIPLVLPAQSPIDLLQEAVDLFQNGQYQKAIPVAEKAGSILLFGICGGLTSHLLYLLVHGLLTRLHFYRLVWHRALFNVGLYALLLGAVDSLSRYLMT